MRNVLGLAFLALVLAFVAVQGANLVQRPPAPAMLKGESVAETEVRDHANQSAPASILGSFPTAVFGALTMAALCYLFVRRRA